MRFISSCVLVTLFFYCGSVVECKKNPSYQPEQIHISFGENATSIVVTWTTEGKTANSVVEYGINGLILKAESTPVLFTDGGSEHRSWYMHKVTLPDLTPESTYEYHCGSDSGWSAVYAFHTVKDSSDWSPKLAIYGDMGYINAQSLTRLQEETQKGNFDAILHVGDFAYDFVTDNARVGDNFMKQIETIAAYVPYMTVAGNHEEAYNFSNYKARFSMPGKSEGLFYSFNLGPAHIIGVSTEVYYFLEYGFKQIVNQYEWLVEDLKEANKAENRAQRPWIITMGHRPMYCSTLDHDDCTYKQCMVRVGLPFVEWFGLEKLFYENAVDVSIWAHEHTYERLWPVYDYKIYNGSYEAPYTNPKAPVHIITGSAGCQEKTDQFQYPLPNFSAFHTSDYGYTRMTIHNSTHLYFEQVSDDKEGAVIDQTWIIQEKHGNFSARNDV